MGKRSGAPSAPATYGDGWDAGALVEARGLCKRYDGFALQDVSLTVEAGSVVGFVGRNGAGKSTTVKALLGLVSLDGGKARVLGCAPADLANGPAAAVKAQVGVVFDTVALPAALKVSAVGRVMRACYGDAWQPDAYARLLGRFGLPSGKRVKDLSRGMGMKLSLACALSHGARLLVLDEATAGLDPMARDEVLDLLRGFMEDETHAILMSSHITTDLERLADAVVCIDAGRIAFARAKDEICDLMGVARCRTADLDAIEESGVLGGEPLTYLRQELSYDVLVPDYYAFVRALPGIACDRLTIDGYMAFMLKGERR